MLILSDFHLVKEAGPALLKTIEEPPASAVFVILAEFVPAELVTIASRCVQIDFRPLRPAEVVAALIADGVEPGRAAELADAAGGRLDRARLLAADPEFERRRQAWRAVPATLDGSGATAARLADELLGLLEGSVDPDAGAPRARAGRPRGPQRPGPRGQRQGRPATGAGSRWGSRISRSAIVGSCAANAPMSCAVGLATLASAYRDRTLAGGRAAASAVKAQALIQTMSANLAYNPGELLSLQALMVRLGRL